MTVLRVCVRVCVCDLQEGLCVVENGGDSQEPLDAVHDQRRVGAQQSPVH